jgi:competence protein ComEA
VSDRGRRRRDLWGWNVPGRFVLGTGALMASVLLAVAAGRSAPAGRPVPVPPLVVDPNTAPAGVLMALPRLGPVLVARIVAERDARAFASLDEMESRVRGIGPATASALRPHLRFNPPRRPPAGP